MKKVLSTALILGALYGTANAAPINSPIYMPEAGKFLSTMDIGYTTSDFDKTVPGLKDDLERSWNINLDGKFGINDRLALNYGFDFDFARKIGGARQSAEFVNFYFGATARAYEMDAHKFDVILNVGQEEAMLYTENNVFVDLALRYGLELNSYNMGFSIGGRFFNDFRSEDYRLKKDFAFVVKFENEFIFSDSFTVGLDLYLNANGDIRNKVEGEVNTKIKSHQEYGFNIDANYALCQNNYIGAYFDMSMSNAKFDVSSYGTIAKDPIQYKFGLRYTTQF